MTYMQEVDPTGATATDGPMSERQAHMLWRLCDEAGDFRAFDPTLTGRRAMSRIAVLRDEIRMSVLPPHTD